MYITIINTSGTSVMTKSVGLVFQAGGGQGSNTPTWLVRQDDLPQIGRELIPHLNANFRWCTTDVPMDVRWFGVKADGVTDDTAALQLAFDNAKRCLDDGFQVSLFLPSGVTRVTSTIVMYGNSALSPQFIGVPRGSNYSTASASILRWDGAVGGTLFFTQGINVGSLRDINFQGSNKAKILWAYSATTFADRSILDASNDTIVDNCTFFGVQVGTPGAGCVQLGTDPALTGGNTYEAAQGYFRNCYFKAEDPGAPGFTFAGMKAFGVKNMSGGNAKIFSFVDCSWLFCDIGLDNLFGSADVVVTNFGMADVINPFAHGSGEIIINGGDCESGDVADSTLITGGNNQAGTFAKLHGLDFASFMAGSIGKAINFGGQLILEHVYMRNGNTSSGFSNPFRVFIGGETGVGNFSMFTSRQNWYYGCGPTTNDFIPAYDNASNNNPVFPVPHTYGGNKILMVSSEGDIGGSVEQSNVYTLKNFNSNDYTYFSSKWNGKIDYSFFQGGNSNSTIGVDVEDVNIITYDPAGNSIITLPSATSFEGRWYLIKKRNASANTLVITPVGGSTIDGTSSFTLKGPYSSVWVFSDGVNWWTFGGQFAVTDGDFRVTGQLGVAITPAYRFEVGSTAVGGALAAVNGASLSSGDILLYLPGPTLTGNFNNWITGGASVTGTLQGTMTNANNSSSTADAAWTIVTGGASGGSPKLNLTVSGVRAWSIGVDNLNSQRFAINRNGALGNSDDVFRINASDAVITTLSGSLFSLVPASGNNNGFTLNTFSSMLPAQRLLSVQNQNAEKAYIDYEGFLNTATLSFDLKRLGQWVALTPTATAFTGIGINSPSSVSGTPSSSPTSIGVAYAIKFLSGATTGNVAGLLSTADVTQFDFRTRFRTTIEMDSAITNQRVFIGLCDSDISGVSTLAGLNGGFLAVFRYDTGLGDTNWQAVTSDGVTASATDTGIPVTANGIFTLEIDMFTAGTAYFRINRATNPQVAKTSNLPTGHTNVGPQLSLTTLSNTAQALYISKVAVEQS